MCRLPGEPRSHLKVDNHLPCAPFSEADVGIDDEDDDDDDDGDDDEFIPRGPATQVVSGVRGRGRGGRPGR